jgi:hypothetical protein
MAVLLGAIKLSEMKEGDVFVRSNGEKVMYAGTDVYYSHSLRKGFRTIYYKVLTGPNAGVFGNTTLIKWKKEYKPQ